jgi:hypothetical protein
LQNILWDACSEIMVRLGGNQASII